MAFFQSNGKGAGGGFNWENAVLSFLGAGPQVQRNQALRLQRQEEARQQAAADRVVQQRESLTNNLTKPNELGGFGVSAGEAERIMSNPEAFGTRFNERYGNFDASPGERRYTPNGGAPATVTQAPTAQDQTIATLRREGGPAAEQLVGTYARGLAMPPMTIPEAGSAIGLGRDGHPRYLVGGPDAPQTAPITPADSAPQGNAATQGFFAGNAPQPPRPVATGPAPAFSATAPLTVDDRSAQFASDNPNTPGFEPPRAIDPRANIPTGNPLDPNLAASPPLRTMPITRHAPRQGGHAAIIQRARRAIANGADREQVRARLRRMGVNPDAL